MGHIDVYFGMRIRGRFDMEELSIRLRNALLCFFAPSEDWRDDRGTMVTDALFLRLMITCWPHDWPQVEGKEYLYTLSGRSIDEKPWESTSDINLSEWMLAKLQRHESPDWYIPTVEELRAEVTKDPLAKP